MATRSFHCSRCDALVQVDDRDQSCACPTCGVWFHAMECERCSQRYLALGDGRQECPHCHLRMRFNDQSVRTIAEVVDPLEANISVVRSRPSPMVGPAFAVGPRVEGDPLAAILSTILWIASI